jgi:anti-sigma28 factor (negative regulator of flagellin synthesis)
MKVHDSYLEPAAPSTGKAREMEETPAGSAKRTGGGGGVEPDRVRVSELSERLLKALQADAVGREARIAELAGAYRAGTYHVDAAVLSSRIVESALAGDA